MSGGDWKRAGVFAGEIQLSISLSCAYSLTPLLNLVMSERARQLSIRVCLGEQGIGLGFEGLHRIGAGGEPSGRHDVGIQIAARLTPFDNEDSILPLR
jgi:hypothetical protein